MRAKSEYLQIRLTPKEKEQLKKLAKKYKLSMAEILLRSCFKEPLSVE